MIIIMHDTILNQEVAKQLLPLTSDNNIAVYPIFSFNHSFTGDEEHIIFLDFDLKSTLYSDFNGVLLGDSLKSLNMPTTVKCIDFIVQDSSLDISLRSLSQQLVNRLANLGYPDIQVRCISNAQCGQVIIFPPVLTPNKQWEIFDINDAQLIEILSKPESSELEKVYDILKNGIKLKPIFQGSDINEWLQLPKNVHQACFTFCQSDASCVKPFFFPT